MAAAGDSGVPSSVPPSEARLKALYSIMQSIENKLGGGEGVEGLYGSIKKGGMDKVLGCLCQQCGLDTQSVLVDIGAGLGRPLMHALLEPGIAGARGIEIDRIKCDKAAAFLRQAILELQRRGVAGAELAAPPIECSAIEKVRSLDGCTHAYSFWEGVPVEGKAAFGALFAASCTLRSVAVVQRAIRTCPLAYMEDLGFGELELAGSFSVSMSGSGRSFTAYVFNKAHLPLALAAPLAAEQAALQSVQTPVQGAEPAAAGVTVTGAVAAAAELEGESAQSRLAGPAEEQRPAVRRGRRQRKPSAKQLSAEDDVEGPAEEQRDARGRRADRRHAASAEAGQAGPQQLAQTAAAVQQEGGGSPGMGPHGRATSRPAAAVAKPATAKLSSPQKGGVQKRASPVKGGCSATASRKLPLESAAACHAVAAPLAPDSGGLLRRAARVIKSGVVDGAAKLRPARQAAAPRWGLQSGQ